MRRAILLLALGAAACTPAPPPWHNAYLPREQWSRDLAQCREQAYQRIERRNSPDSPALQPSGPGQPPLLVQMERDRLLRERDRMVDSCMRGKGYLPNR